MWRASSLSRAPRAWAAPEIIGPREWFFTVRPGEPSGSSAGFPPFPSPHAQIPINVEEISPEREERTQTHVLHVGLPNHEYSDPGQERSPSKKRAIYGFEFRRASFRIG
jgi:hypothetical protein